MPITDRELLIRVDQKLIDLSINIDKNFEDNATVHKELTRKVQKINDQKIICSKTFVTHRLFYWVAGLIVVSIMAISGLAYDNHGDINSNEAKIESIHKDTHK